MAKDTKIISFISGLPQSGQTTIANLVGLSVANQGKTVLLIEFSKYTGMSVFLNGSLSNKTSSLKNVLIDPSKAKDNIISSRNHKNLFYICQNIKSSFSDLDSYNANNIDLVLKEVLGIFDYVFLDLPSDFSDIALNRVHHSTFNHKINNRFIIMNENVLSLKRLNDYDNAFIKSNANISEKKKATVIVNKSKNRYSPIFAPFLSDLPYTNVVNLVNVIDVPEYTYLCNEGKLLNLGNTKEAKLFLSSIDMIAKILLEDLEGIGVSRSKSVDLSVKKVKRANLLSFGGSVNKSKKEKTSKKSKKGKNKEDSSLNEFGFPVDDRQNITPAVGKSLQQPEKKGLFGKSSKKNQKIKNGKPLKKAGNENSQLVQDLYNQQPMANTQMQYSQNMTDSQLQYQQPMGSYQHPQQSMQYQDPQMGDYQQSYQQSIENSQFTERFQNNDVNYQQAPNQQPKKKGMFGLFGKKNK